MPKSFADGSKDRIIAVIILLLAACIMAFIRLRRAEPKEPCTVYPFAWQHDSTFYEVICAKNQRIQRIQTRAGA